MIRIRCRGLGLFDVYVRVRMYEFLFLCISKKPTQIPRDMLINRRFSEIQSCPSYIAGVRNARNFGTTNSSPNEQHTSLSYQIPSTSLIIVVSRNIER